MDSTTKKRAVGTYSYFILQLDLRFLTPTVCTRPGDVGILTTIPRKSRSNFHSPSFKSPDRCDNTAIGTFWDFVENCPPPTKGARTARASAHSSSAPRACSVPSALVSGNALPARRHTRRCRARFREQTVPRANGSESKRFREPGHCQPPTVSLYSMQTNPPPWNGTAWGIFVSKQRGMLPDVESSLTFVRHSSLEAG